MSGPPPPVPVFTRPGYNPDYSAHHGPPPPTSTQQPPPPGPVVGGYYANWTVYSGFGPSKASYYHLNTILYAFAKVDGHSGEVTLSDPWGDIEKPFEASLGDTAQDGPLPGFKGNLGEIAVMKRRTGGRLKCVLSVGGAGDEITKAFRKIIVDQGKIRRFGDSCAALVERYGAALDGIDVDYEHPENESEGRGLIELLRYLRWSLDQMGMRNGRERPMVSVAVGAGEWTAQWMPIRELADVVDRVYLMTYDFSGSWDKTLNHQSALFSSSPDVLSSHAAVQYYLQRGMPPHKLVLGVPLYSRSFLTKHGNGTPGTQYHKVSGKGEGATDEGTHMYNQLPRPGATEYVDPQMGVAWCFDGKEWCSYDNPTSMSYKTDYVKRSGLGGVFFWELAGGHPASSPPHPRDLVAAAWNGLNGGGGGAGW